MNLDLTPLAFRSINAFQNDSFRLRMDKPEESIQKSILSVEFDITSNGNLDMSFLSPITLTS
jgi:hypothetical protein